MRDINQAGLELIKSFEGIMDGDPTTVNLDAYLDPIGIWTIGWGHAIVVGNDFLRGKENKKRARDLYPGGLTLAQAEALLRGDVLDTCRDVESLVKAPVTDNQFAALVSFAYNVGAGNLKKSTLLRLLNAGDYAGAANEFQKWDRAGGRVLSGLTRRRKAEAELFRK
ncbi:MAG: lysozyme [Gammaproteobacteria bacterium]|nr:lysozyme [Gammaproteobacteria bacterium]